MRKKLKVCFIPSPENDHKPHFLREKSVISIVVISLFIELLILGFFLPVFPNKLNNLAAVLPGVLVSLTNESRSDNNLNTLEVNEQLTTSAQLKANDMAEKGYFSHLTPDGKSPWYFVQQSGYQYEYAGENLAVNFVDSSDVHDAWMNSPTHRENILRNGFTEIGIATAKGTYKGRNAIFVAQYFGRPENVSEEVVVTNLTGEASLVETTDIVSEEGEVIGKSSIIKNTYEDVEEEIKISNEREESVGEDISIAKTSAQVRGLFVKNSDVSWKDWILSHPKTTFSTVLYFILILTIIALTLTFFIKIRIQDKKTLSYAVLIIVILLSVLFFNQQIVEFFGEIESVSR